MTPTRERHVADENGNGNGNGNGKPWFSVGFGGRLGPWLKLGGRESVPTLLRILIFISLTALGVMLYYQDVQESQRHEHRKMEHERLQMSLEASVMIQRDIAEAQRELTYVQTLSQQEREALKLTMPDSLRRRLNGRHP